MKVNKIVIVGGGSSGWMTAAALCKNFPDLDVTLIESKNIKTIGVGESTLAEFNSYLELLGLKDEEWMHECDATYKVSIAFTDFREKGSKFQYPFGLSAAPHVSLGHDCWPALRQMDPESCPLEKFAEFYNANTYLADLNKLTHNQDQSIPNFKFKYDTAYHFDATKFGLYLKDKICKPAGIKHILEEVSDVEQEENGNIKYVITESGSKFDADIFIDCSGFKSILLEQKMGGVFESFNKTLLNDRALATKLSYNDPNIEMENVTNCTAIEHGWVWNIPLWNRIGSGYVYSSKFIDRDQAELEFRNHLSSNGKQIPEDAEILDIHIKHGVMDRAWIGNVLGVGLSYGFVEPLESTGLLTTHENIYRFVRILQKRNRVVTSVDRTLLNNYLSDILHAAKSFLEMHYGLSLRDDTEYWRYVTDIDYGNTADMEQLRDNVTRVSNFNGIRGGLIYIAAGMGYLPSYRFGSGYGYISNDDQEALRNVFREYEMFSHSLREYVKTLPTHYEFLKENIYV
ncbi:tryptophan 7-halogenase [archaeon]|jgi:tryptophan halogenase|nr:tryptophan 7-halogenase [archaeon]